MLKIGITGGIGSGKSVVCRVFQLLGAPVYDSDFRAKWVMAHDEVLHRELKEAFGSNVFDDQQHLDRKYLSGLVFNDPEKLNLLNSLVHPRVRLDFTQWLEQHREKPYVIKEAALMYESEAWKQMDQIIAVYAPLDLRLQRVLSRDTHRTKADVEAIIDKQLNEEEKRDRAEHVVFNDEQNLLIPQVLKLHAFFTQQSR